MKNSEDNLEYVNLAQGGMLESDPNSQKISQNHFYAYAVILAVFFCSSMSVRLLLKKLKSVVLLLSCNAYITGRFLD